MNLLNLDIYAELQHIFIFLHFLVELMVNIGNLTFPMYLAISKYLIEQCQNISLIKFQKVS